MVFGLTEAELVSELSYAVPLVLVAATMVGVAYWTHARTRTLPKASATPRPSSGLEPPEAGAYLALTQGRYVPALNLLGRRLAIDLKEKFGLDIGERRGLDVGELTVPLPESLTIPQLVDDLLVAWRAAARAETPTWTNQQLPWILHRRQARAQEEFAAIVAELALAFPILEGR